MNEVDWKQRVLCPDGACTGVIGPDGTCKLCGHVMPNWGDERMRGLQPDPDEDVDADRAPDDDELEDDELADEAEDEADDEAEDEADDDELADEADDGEGEVGEQAGETGGEWTERKLCDDGACIGVIGKDGTCTVCGKRSAA